MSLRAGKIHIVRQQAEEVGTTGTFRTCFVLKNKPIYAIQLKMDSNAAGRDNFNWILKRAVGVTEAPDYDNEFAAGADYMTKEWGEIAHHQREIELSDLRLLDNHIIWIEYDATTGDTGFFFELLYTTGY